MARLDEKGNFVDVRSYDTHDSGNNNSDQTLANDINSTPDNWFLVFTTWDQPNPNRYETFSGPLYDAFVSLGFNKLNWNYRCAWAGVAQKGSHVITEEYAAGQDGVVIDYCTLRAQVWRESDVTLTVSANDPDGLKKTEYEWSLHDSPTGDWTAFNSGSDLTQTEGGIWYLHIKVTNNNDEITTERYGPFLIDLFEFYTTAYPEGDYIHLDWKVNDTTEDFSYMLHKKEASESEFQTIPAKDSIKVLNIYPNVSDSISFTNWKGESYTLPKSASLKMWMEEPNQEHQKGYGMGLVSVDAVSITSYNANPDNYLKENNGNYKYDVIFYGAWDSNASTDINLNGAQKIEEFIKSGRGFLFGHDTIMLPEQDIKILRDYANLKIGRTIDYDKGGWSNDSYGSEQVEIVKKGLLTNHPWNIGNVGDILSVPYSHSTAQQAHGDIWMKYAPPFQVEGAEALPENNFYLTTWNNTAMIQTGHSNAEATSDEQKVLANTMFYLGQITTATSWDDNTGQDVAPPTKPDINNVSLVDANTIDISFNAASDDKTTYQYFVEAKGSKGTNINSDIVTQEIKSGLAGYSVVIDNNPDTTPSNTVTHSSTDLRLDYEFNGEFYVHVAAIDNVGNMSEVSHYHYLDTEAPYDPNIHVTGKDETSISLEWTVGDLASDIKNVILYFQESNSSGDHIKDIDINGDGTTEYSLSVTGQNTYTVEGLDPYTYYRYYVRVIDDQDNVRNDGYYTVRTDDSVPPTIDITSHSDNSDIGYINGNQLTISGTAADNNEVDKVILNASGAVSINDLVIDDTSPENWSYTRSYPEGNTRLEVKAVDMAGIVSETKYIEFDVDTEAPWITWYNHGDRTWRNTVPDIYTSNNDDISGIGDVKLAVTDSTTKPSSWISDNDSPNNTYFKNTLESKGNGEWYCHLEVTDNNGNSVYEYNGPYKIDKEMPEHVSHSVSGAQYVDGDIHYVKPGTTVYIELEGRDNQELRYNYLNLNGDGIDIRAHHTITTGDFNEYRTGTLADIIGAEKVNDNTTRFEVLIDSSTPSNTVFEVNGWHRDKADNLQRFTTPLRIVVDGDQAEMTGWEIKNAAYFDGQNYWGKQGDQMTFNLKGYDAISGAKRGYIQLVNKETGDAEHASYNRNEGYLSDSREEPNIDVTTGRLISSDDKNMEIEFDFTLGNQPAVYDLQWYWYDNVKNSMDYTDTGKDIRIDTAPPFVDVGPYVTMRRPNIIEIDINVEDSQSGVKSVEYKFDHSTHYSGDNLRTTGTQDTLFIEAHGEWYLHIRAEDNAGNVVRQTFGPYVNYSDPKRYMKIQTPGGEQEVPLYELNQRVDNRLRIKAADEVVCIGLVPPDDKRATEIRVKMPEAIYAVEGNRNVFRFSEYYGRSVFNTYHGMGYGQFIDPNLSNDFTLGEDEITIDTQRGFDGGELV